MIQSQYTPTHINFCTLLLFLSICFSNKTTAQQSADFIPLFNGTDFTGWKIEDKPANFSIIDSALVLKMTNNTSRHSFIRTKKKYKDFILEFDCKRDSDFDSGVLFRGILMPKKSPIALNGYMLKFDPSPTRLWTGGIFMDFGNKSEWLYTLADDQRAQQAEKSAAWNHYRIEVIGKHIKVWINGIPTVNLIDERYDEGYIAFKIHRLIKITPKWNETIQASFKNIKIISKSPQDFAKAISIPVKQTSTKWKPLFNGKDLSNFAIVGAKGKVTVEDGNIVLYRTPNTTEHTYLRTNAVYKDFILELDAKRDPSFQYGILFRAIDTPNSDFAKLNGYQVKIDATSRHWTGGIFDDFGDTWNWISNLTDNLVGQKAEKPVGEWNHWRIEVIGNRITVWLNGVETTSITNHKYKEGYIALKIHFLKGNSSTANAKAWFKNINILDSDLEKYILSN